MVPDEQFDIADLKLALMKARADLQAMTSIRADAVKVLTNDAVKSALGELQGFCDERARRWAVTKERARDSMAKLAAHTQMTEALAISQHVARILRRSE